MLFEFNVTEKGPPVDFEGKPLYVDFRVSNRSETDVVHLVMAGVQTYMYIKLNPDT
jgi:hypothetical protein